MSISLLAVYRQLWAKVIPACKVGQQWRIAQKDIKWLRQWGKFNGSQ